jgi:hypothetical protein
MHLSFTSSHIAAPYSAHLCHLLQYFFLSSLESCVHKCFVKFFCSKDRTLKGWPLGIGMEAAGSFIHQFKDI